MRWLEEHQRPAGYWVGQLRSNSSIEAEWVLAMHVLGAERDVADVVRCILHEQRQDGAWDIYRGAPSGDLSTTVECYAALRAAGYDPACEQLRKAREWILDNGGLAPVRVFTKIWLALIGEWPWHAVPTLPPELIYLPKWAPINIYRFSSWARATIVPLCVLSALRLVRPLDPSARLDELFPKGRERQDYRLLPRSRTTLGRLFAWADRAMVWYGSLPFQPGRATALKLCTEWILRRQEADGCFGGAIQAPWIYSLLALRAQGFPLDHPVLKAGLDAAFNEPWAQRTKHGTYLQCCTSPVWDTLLSLLALTEAGLDCQRSGTVARGLTWALGQQVAAPGDWCEATGRGLVPGGWAFEYENDTYPDLDDTAVAMMVLSRLETTAADPGAVSSALDRALTWTLGMRCSNGAWAAFDRDNDSALVAEIPFCDFGEVLDPPSVDVTAHVLEALAHRGRDKADPVVARAIAYIRSEQEPKGSWFGRWGVNHLYGTAAVLPALKAVGEDMGSPYVRRAADWLVAHQNDDGGWGETCASYMDDSLRGVGVSTASQTAWALIGLMAVWGAEDGDDAGLVLASLQRGLRWLVEQQTPEGTWNEQSYTGTGFPGYGLGARTDVNRKENTLAQGKELGRGFMIHYDMYRHYFPLLALARARRLFFAHAPPR